MGWKIIVAQMILFPTLVILFPRLVILFPRVGILITKGGRKIGTDMLLLKSILLVIQCAALEFNAKTSLLEFGIFLAVELKEFCLALASGPNGFIKFDEQLEVHHLL